jgi:hypothetical protein
MANIVEMIHNANMDLFRRGDGSVNLGLAGSETISGTEGLHATRR